jgi:hypothetical protein
MTRVAELDIDGIEQDLGYVSFVPFDYGTFISTKNFRVYQQKMAINLNQNYKWIWYKTDDCTFFYYPMYVREVSHVTRNAMSQFHYIVDGVDDVDATVKFKFRVDWNLYMMRKALFDEFKRRSLFEPVEMALEDLIG